MDLFIFRRKKQNISLPLLKSNAYIYKFGAFFGGGFLIIVLLLSLTLLIQISFNKARRDRLKPYVLEYDQYVEKINNIKFDLTKLKKINSDLTQAIVSIRSGSAILSEISRLMPSQITLTSINVEGNKLYIKGIVNQEKSLELINVFIIELANSQFINENSVKLVNAKNKDQDNESKESFINFQINSEIIEKTENIDKEYLKALGSNGLYKRVANIQKRGLLK